MRELRAWVLAAAFMIVIHASMTVPGRCAEETAVSIVEVPVYVWDDKGDAVTGLSETDFEIYEDDKKQEIQVFLEVSLDDSRRARLAATRNHDAPDATRPALPPHQSRRHVLLVFDFILNTPAGVIRMLDGASSFIENEMRDHDMVSVWGISSIKGLQMLSNFTSDRADLKACLQRVRNGKAPRSPGASGIGDLLPLNQVSATPAEGFGTPDASAIARLEERAGIASFLDELERLALLTSDIPGRKFCLLFSVGFAAGTGAADSASFSSADTSSAAALIGELGKASGMDPHILLQIDRITRKFATADCQLFSFETRGLYSEPNLENIDRRSSGGRLFSESLASLEMLAEQTGGECYKNSNNLSMQVSQMIQKTSTYYLLAYRTPERESHADPKKFHRIEVKAAREGVHLRSRPGYADKPDTASSEPERAWIRLAATAMYGLPAHDIEFDAAAWTVPSGAAGSQQAAVAVTFQVPGSQFAATTTDMPLEFYVFAIDENASVATYVRGSQLITKTDLDTRVLKSGIRYTDMLILPARNKLVLRFAVLRASDGAIGASTPNVDLALDHSQLFMAAPIFPAASTGSTAAAPAWLNLQGIDFRNPPSRLNGHDADFPFRWEGKAFSPDLDPFRNTGPKAMLVKLYSTRSDIASSEFAFAFEALDSSGKVIARPDLSSGARANRTDSGLDYLFLVDRQKMPDGTTSLRVKAIDKRTGVEAHRETPLTRCDTRSREAAEDRAAADHEFRSLQTIGELVRAIQ